MNIRQKCSALVAASFLILAGLSATASEVDDIRAIYNRVEKQISAKELLQIQLNYNANEYPVDGVPEVLSFWVNPESDKVAAKISTHHVASLTRFTTEFYYNKNGECVFVYHVVDNTQEKTTNQFRIYYKNKTAIQVILTDFSGKKEISKETLTENFGIDLGSLVKDFFKTSQENMAFFNVVMNRRK